MGMGLAIPVTIIIVAAIMGLPGLMLVRRRPRTPPVADPWPRD